MSGVIGAAVAQNIAFYIIAVAMAVAAIGVVRSQNIVHAALYLVVVLAGAAGLYILVAAEFVAWVQVLIYIGAIVILFLFGIMLTRAPMRSSGSLDNSQRWAAMVVSLFMFGVITALLVDACAEAQRLAPGVELIDLVAFDAADLQPEAVRAEVDDRQQTIGLAFAHSMQGGEWMRCKG